MIRPRRRLARAPTSRKILGARHTAYRVFARSLLPYVALTAPMILVVGDVRSTAELAAARGAGPAAEHLQRISRLLGAVTLLSLLALLLGMPATGRTLHLHGPAWYGSPTSGARSVAAFGIVCMPPSVVVFGLQAVEHAVSLGPSRPEAAVGVFRPRNVRSGFGSHLDPRQPLIPHARRDADGGRQTQRRPRWEDPTGG